MQRECATSDCIESADNLVTADLIIPQIKYQGQAPNFESCEVVDASSGETSSLVKFSGNGPTTLAGFSLELEVNTVRSESLRLRCTLSNAGTSFTGSRIIESGAF